MRCAGQAWHTAHWLGTCAIKACQRALMAADIPGAMCSGMLGFNVGAARRAQLPTAAFLFPMSSSERPPTIDSIAASRWHAHAPALSPWLHEEVARRMEARLQWIRQPPTAWCHWDAVRGGLLAHALLRQRYPGAECFVVETAAHLRDHATSALALPWWRTARWTGAGTRFEEPADGAVQMLWANMALHMAPDPQALIARWHRAIGMNGYLMFSCLGPDTLREIHALYAERGWSVPGHAFTDMHDWGDMLLQAGFAEPVMDMERITLTFADAPRLLQELRELGANLHPQRFAGLRGRQWHARLLQALAKRLATPSEEGRLSLTFEIVYGHAFKPPPRVALGERSTVSLQDMRAMLGGSAQKGK